MRLDCSCFNHLHFYSVSLLRVPCSTILHKMSENILYESSFKVSAINSAKYDRVSRIQCVSDQSAETEAFLDVNTELYPVEVDDRVTIALALSLNLDGSKDDSKGWRNVGRGEQTLADEYDYVCHGKIYRFDEGEGQNM